MYFGLGALDLCFLAMSIMQGTRIQVWASSLYVAHIFLSPYLTYPLLGSQELGIAATAVNMIIRGTNDQTLPREIRSSIIVPRLVASLPVSLHITFPSLQICDELSHGDLSCCVKIYNMQYVHPAH